MGGSTTLCQQHALRAPSAYTALRGHNLAGSVGVAPPAHGSLSEQLRRGAGTVAETAPSGAPLLDLFVAINRAFDEERRLGYAINAHQPPESTARLDAAVRKAVSEYVTRGYQDWRQMAFNEHHYVRHLIEENENFELILICWGRGQQSRVHNHANSVSCAGCFFGRAALRPPLRPPVTNHLLWPAISDILCAARCSTAGSMCSVEAWRSCGLPAQVCRCTASRLWLPACLESFPPPGDPSCLRARLCLSIARCLTATTSLT